MTDSFHTTFNNSSGLTITGTGVTVPCNYSWAANDDILNSKLKLEGSGSWAIQMTTLASNTKYQEAQVLVKASNGIADHFPLIIQSDDYTANDVNCYIAFLGRDSRIDGTETNVYFCIEKAWGKGVAYQNALYDAKLIGTDIDPNTVYLMRITTLLYEASHMEVMGKLYTVVGDTTTLIATSTLNDYYGGVDGDPVTGNQSEFVILGDGENSRVYYVDNYSFSWKNKVEMDLSKLQYINLATIDPAYIGYAFGCISGDYLYLAPCYTANYQGVHGKFARYQISKRIDESSSWTFFDAELNKDHGCRGFHGAVVVGNYIYYSPLWNLIPVAYTCSSFTGRDTWSNGHVVRYNTTLDFESSSSWEVVDISNFSISAYGPKYYGWKGFVGNVTDGRYVYFVPYGTNPGQHGLTARFDTQGSFTSEGSWQFFSLSNIGELRGYHLGCYDGSRYVYYSPFCKSYSNYHGQVVRYDTTGSFTASSSWETVDLESFNAWAEGFYGCVKGGSYIYFVGNTSGVIARYNTTLTFSDSASWEFINSNTHPIASGYHYGYSDITYDGSYYVYLAPDFNTADSAIHGWLARHDVTSSLDSGWEYVDLTTKNAYLKGHHGIVYKNSSIFLINIHQGPGGADVASGWISRLDLSDSMTTANIGMYSIGAITPLTPATKCAIVTQPGGSISSLIFVTQPVVQIQNASSNNIKVAGINVVATKTGDGVLGGTTTVVTDANGIATFSNLKITGTGSHTLTFTPTGLSPTVSASFSVSSLPTKSAIIMQPGASVSRYPGFSVTGSPDGYDGYVFLNNATVVQLQDISNNNIYQSGINVVASIASGDGTLGGVTTVATNSRGIAVFSGLTIKPNFPDNGAVLPLDLDPLYFTLTFSPVGYAGVTSSSFALYKLPSPTFSSSSKLVQDEGAYRQLFGNAQDGSATDYRQAWKIEIGTRFDGSPFTYLWVNISGLTSNCAAIAVLTFPDGRIIPASMPSDESLGYIVGMSGCVLLVQAGVTIPDSKIPVGTYIVDLVNLSDSLVSYPAEYYKVLYAAE